MKGRFAMTALLAAVLAPAALAAQGIFEGVVTMRTSVSGHPGAEMKYYQKGSKVRHEASGGGQQGVSIFNGATGESIMIMPAMKQYMVVNMNDMMKQMPPGAQRNQDLSKMKVTPTGRSEVVAGIKCDHYTFSDVAQPNAPPMDVCGAAGMGFMGAGSRGMGSVPSTASLARSTNPQLAALARRGFFPLKMTMKAPDGSTMTWEVTKIERRALDASLFAPPPGYTKMNMPAMPGMGGMPKR